MLLAAGKGLKTAKTAAWSAAETVTEHTYKYTEASKKMAEKHLELALTHWRTRMGSNWQPSINWVRSESTSPSTGPAWLSKNQAPIVLRKRREHVKSTSNWALFYYHFNRDHAKSNLIWNLRTRSELQETLSAEIQAL